MTDKMTDNIINKTTPIKELKSNTIDIHPLVNFLIELPDDKKKQYFVLPQIFNNVIIFGKDLKKSDDANLSDSELFFSDTQASNKDKDDDDDNDDDHLTKFEKIDSKSSNTPKNESINFSFPINSNNFLDVIFNITNIKQLTNWLNTYDTNDKDTVDLVLNLFWKNYYNTVDQNMTDFNELNYLIVKIMFDKILTQNEVQLLSNKIISKNYKKKIKYLEKIKKYISE